MKKVAAILLLALFLGALHAAPETVRAETVMEEEPIVIVLDPGHGGSDGGAVRTWGGKKYREKDLNLKIARYCSEELEKYAGVEVYMTRQSDTYVSLLQRVEMAAEVDADLFVSLHNNADYKASSRGACVFYPNSKYRKYLGEYGMEAAFAIQNRLVSLGIKNNGIAYRDSENKTKYPNKKTADYYYVIRESKLRDIPGIIVEHAYVSNPTDCRVYLGTDAKLKKLGLADARGLADCYGLKKGTDTSLLSAESLSDGSVSLKWERAKKMDGYSVYRRPAGEEEFELIATLEGEKTTEYTDNSASAAGVYEYCVRAYIVGNDVGRYTAMSDVFEAARVPAPLYLTLEITEGGTHILSFGSVEGADGYVISRRSEGEEEWTAAAELMDGETSWIDITAEPGVRYEYQICAYIDTENDRITGSPCFLTDSGQAAEAQ